VQDIHYPSWEGGRGGIVLLKLWNKLPFSIRNLSFVFTFTTSLKTNVFTVHFTKLLRGDLQFRCKFHKFAMNLGISLPYCHWNGEVWNELGNFAPNFVEITTEHHHKNALSTQAAKCWKSKFLISRVSVSCGVTLNFLRGYQPRSCVTLRLIDARQGTFSFKHWKLFFYQYSYHSARADRVTFLHLLCSVFPLWTKISTILAMVCLGSVRYCPVWDGPFRSSYKKWRKNFS